MADGLNQARAMRVAEIISDFRNLQYYLAAIETPSGSAGNSLDGYAILRACVADGRTVLNSAYAHASPPPRGDVDAEKAQLIIIIADASVRRFKCQRAYMRAVAAQRWAAARAQILQGRAPHQGHAAQLQQLDAQLRSDLTAISDAHVEETLRAHDAAQGKYLDDDPTLQVILQQLQNLQ